MNFAHAMRQLCIHFEGETPFKTEITFDPYAAGIWVAGAYYADDLLNNFPADEPSLITPDDRIPFPAARQLSFNIGSRLMIHYRRADVDKLWSLSIDHQHPALNGAAYPTVTRLGPHGQTLAVSVPEHRSAVVRVR